MINIKRIFPECCADTFLVSLLFQQEMLPDYDGIGDVANAMNAYPGEEFIIGLIDTDKFKRPDPKYLREFTEVVDDKLDSEGVIVMKMPGTNRHIIRLHPAFEKWALATAQSCGIYPEKYRFETFKKLAKEAKKLEVAKNKDIEAFLMDIINRNPPAIQTLRFWLEKAGNDN